MILLEDFTGFLGCECTLLACGQPFIHENPQVFSVPHSQGCHKGPKSTPKSTEISAKGTDHISPQLKEQSIQELHDPILCVSRVQGSLVLLCKGRLWGPFQSSSSAFGGCQSFGFLVPL